MRRRKHKLRPRGKVVLVRWQKFAFTCLVPEIHESQGWPLVTPKKTLPISFGSASKGFRHFLLLALRRYYDDALVRYNLACYWCVMGSVEEAREMLETAFKKDTSLRKLAETDEDLAALR